MTNSGGIKWEAKDGAFFSIVGDHCYALRRESWIGIQTRDTLSVHTGGEDDEWLTLAVSEEGALSSLGLIKSDPEITVTKKISTLFNSVKAKLHKDALQSSLENLNRY